VPEPGDEIAHDGLVFHVDEVEGTRIDKLTVVFAERRDNREDGEPGEDAAAEG
jgi:CBS domain containing-hemolysin-like protein